MHLSNPAKFFPASILLWFLMTGCGYWSTAPIDPGSAMTVAESDIPFSTKVPENCKFDLVITANGKERKIGFAKSGNVRRIDFDVDTHRHRAFLRTDVSYVLLFDKMVYAVLPGQSAADIQMPELAPELLDRSGHARFTKLGTENGLVKYAVSRDGRDRTETFIFVDETIGLPVRHEIYSIEGEKRVLEYMSEIRNFETQPDNGLFEIPAGFRKITPEEFYKIAG